VKKGEDKGNKEKREVLEWTGPHRPRSVQQGYRNGELMIMIAKDPMVSTARLHLSV